MKRRTGHAAAGVLLATAAGLYVLAAWQSHPGFYDGFAPPADTYRWVKAPDGVTTNGLKPLPGATNLAVSTDHARVAGGAVATGEKQPQALLQVPAAALRAPAADSVEVDLTPTAAPSRPETEVIVGNLYCVTATTSLVKDQALSLTLAYSSQLPSADAIFRYDDETLTWSRLATSHDGRAATVTASITSLGCYAPAALAGVATTTSASGSGNRLLPLVAAGTAVLVLLAGFPLYLRARRDRRLKQRT
ncbi:MAG: hypothetical protein M3Z98_04955 [Candidatus Dormibacteraeota bacterium]|nr:hypothetical protein [Candidatus Dormibacteraeota bacterium]